MGRTPNGFRALAKAAWPQDLSSLKAARAWQRLLEDNLSAPLSLNTRRTSLSRRVASGGSVSPVTSLAADLALSGH